MTHTDPQVSIVIPTLDGGVTLPACLDAVNSQIAPWNYDVTVVDSGSVDGTQDVARGYGASLLEIPTSEFSHGGTRNAAALDSRGRFVVFLVQDAEPVGTSWLKTLVEACESRGAAGSFGSQRPRTESSAYARYVMASVLPDVDGGPVEKRIEPGTDWDQLSPVDRYRLSFFHNANSCVRRDVLRAIPLRDVGYGEDMDWASRALRSGQTIVYEPRAVVFHSHDRPLTYTFRRAYSDHSLVSEIFGYRMISSPWSLPRRWAWTVRDAAGWIGGQDDLGLGRPRALIGIAAHSWMQLVGAYLGARSHETGAGSSIGGALDRMVRRGV